MFKWNIAYAVSGQCIERFAGAALVPIGHNTKCEMSLIADEMSVLPLQRETPRRAGSGRGGKFSFKAFNYDTLNTKTQQPPTNEPRLPKRIPTKRI